MLLFQKLVDETQISKPPEPTKNHDLKELWILLPLRADLLCTLQCEIPCILIFTKEKKFRFLIEKKILYS